MKLQGKVVVVTGGSAGLGRELVLGLLARGASVAALGRNADALAETAQLAGEGRARLGTFVLDVTDAAAVAALPEKVLARFGAVDGLVNNAGIIQPVVRLKDLDTATIDRVLNVNLFGTLHMTRALLPLLLQRPEAHLANVSSLGGFLPVPGQTIYGASKAAVKLLTEGLASECLGTPVRVSLVLPGAIDTNIVANSGIDVSKRPPGQRKQVRKLAPDKAAAIILDGLERDRPRIIVGPDAAFMDVLYRLNPTRAARFIHQQMRNILPA